MSKVHKFPFVIAFADTDAERARMNWLKGHFSIGDDVGFVVKELNIKYFSPLRLSDEVVVETVMTDVGAAVVKIEQKFMKNDSVCAIMTLRVAYLGKDMQPKRIPEEFIRDLI